MTDVMVYSSSNHSPYGTGRLWLMYMGRMKVTKKGSTYTMSNILLHCPEIPDGLEINKEDRYNAEIYWDIVTGNVQMTMPNNQIY